MCGGVVERCILTCDDNPGSVVKRLLFACDDNSQQTMCHTHFPFIYVMTRFNRNSRRWYNSRTKGHFYHWQLLRPINSLSPVVFVRHTRHLRCPSTDVILDGLAVTVVPVVTAWLEQSCCGFCGLDIVESNTTQSQPVNFCYTPTITDRRTRGYV